MNIPGIEDETEELEDDFDFILPLDSTSKSITAFSRVAAYLSPLLCSHCKAHEKQLIFSNKRHRVYFGRIRPEALRAEKKKEAEEGQKFWGINWIAKDKEGNKRYLAFIFDYCPWCGGKIEFEREEDD